MKKLIGCFLCAAFTATQYWALAIAPPDAMMGDVYRILFVHVPAAWTALVLFTLSFVGSVAFLFRGTRAWDRLALGAAEVGAVFTGLVLCLGSLWGRPTWGVWWTWDPRLTTTLILFILYTGYLILRRLIDDPERRTKMAASVGALIYLNVPIVYFSVTWWRGLHQVQSSPQTMDLAMVMPLRANAIVFLALGIFFLAVRMQLAQRKERLDDIASIPPMKGVTS